MDWHIEGDLVLSCNCEVFCPCVVSLGRARPSEGDCRSWWAVAIDRGAFGGVRLDGLNVAVLLEVPGRMADGGWTIGLYVDDRAQDDAAQALEQIFTGRVGGSTGWWQLVVSNVLGVRRAPVTVERTGKEWRVEVPKVVDGLLAPVPGADGTAPTQIVNSRYWIAPVVDVCVASRSRIRDWGRNWELSGRSAEHARISWSGP